MGPESNDDRVSVVVPVYNGERYVVASLRKIADYLAARGGEHELVVVDDGSDDGTLAAVRAFREESPVKVVVVNLPDNRGKGFALRQGLGEARGELVLFTDADLAYPVANFTRVIDALQTGAELAIASRVHPESRYVTSPRFFRRIYTRHTLGRAFNLLTRFTLVPHVHDTQAGLKGFRARALARVLPHLTLERFSFDVELLVVARGLGLGLVEVPVTFEYQSEPSSIELGRDSVRMLTDLGKVAVRRLLGAYPSDPGKEP